MSRRSIHLRLNIIHTVCVEAFAKFNSEPMPWCFVVTMDGVREEEEEEEKEEKEEEEKRKEK